MAAVLETPSRIWRRIEANQNREIPSLPSIPLYEDSAEEGEATSGDILQSDHDDDLAELENTMSTRMHSTPTHTGTTLSRRPSSASSTARFAQSIESRSARLSGEGLSTSRGQTTRMQHASFEVPSLPRISPGNKSRGSVADDRDVSRSTVPDVYLPPLDDEDDEGLPHGDSLGDNFKSFSKSPSLSHTPRKPQDYSQSLKSEPKGSPFEKYRNVAMKRGATRARTPSLSRTSSTDASSPSHSTPRSAPSISLPDVSQDDRLSPAPPPRPRSRTASPAIRVTQPDEENSHSIDQDTSRSTRDAGLCSMDITDVHVSPPRLDENEPEAGYQTENQDDDHEPTFSSEGEPTPYAPRTRPIEAASPSTTVTFTPTPAYPRQRARFNVPPSQDDDTLRTPAPRQHEDEEKHDDLVTPATRRKSFLLSVINSTARPRLKAPTPHPKRFQSETPGPSTIDSPVAGGGVGNGLPSAFAGVTVRPRLGSNRRLSHPLAHEISASPTPSEDGTQHATGYPTTWATPSHQTPTYDGGPDRASFISTASSHDLVTHHKVNTSFDPAMGFGTGGHGVGRFNATKLNNYLHGLNRRLQEENEVLLQRLRKLEEERGDEPTSGAAETSRRLSGGSRRRSSTGTSLGGVKEEAAETWLEEKAELEDMVEGFKNDLMACMSEKEEAEKALEEEKEERERDKERWKERMAEVEQGVSGIISNLEEKVAAAEKRAKAAEDGNLQQVRALERSLEELRGERDLALERASKAERLLESGKDLGSALTEANQRIASVMNDLRNANSHIKELEEEVAHADTRVEEMEKELEAEREAADALENELNTKSDGLAADRAKIRQLEAEIRRLNEELAAANQYGNELEEGAGEAIDRIEALEADLAAAQATAEKLTVSEQQATRDLESLQEKVAQAQEAARQMEEALEDAEKKMMEDEEEVADLKAQLAAAQRERQREAHNKSEEVSRGLVEPSPAESDLQALEAELDDAHKEIARLTTLLEQSPARKAIEQAKDMKIEMLEREKEELLERNRALRTNFKEAATPSRVYNTSGISPIHRHVLAMSIKAPKTPGPLPEMSWLNSTHHDPSVAPFVAEISRLQRELDRANESIDDKLDKLEDAGLGVVGLTRKLGDARAKITALEDEIARLARRDELRMRRLSRARCKKCNIKLDLVYRIQAEDSSLDVTTADGLPDEPPTPPTRTSEALKANLQNINAHLDELRTGWEEEKKRLLGEKATLESQASKLQKEVKTTKEDARRAVERTRSGDRNKANVESELEKAKRTISVLETELGNERSRLRSMMTDQERMQREKKQIELDLQRTESDMNEVRDQLQALKKDNRNLEKELRENNNAEQKARLLEKKVTENAETIEQLRQERALLANNHKELQKRFAEVSESSNRAKKEYSAHSASHDALRQELDQHRLEIEDLRKALDTKSNDLQRVEKEKEKMATEKTDVQRTIAALEADLRRVRRDAESFGRDLNKMKAEKERLEAESRDELSKADRARKQAHKQIEHLNAELDTQRRKIGEAQAEIRNHVCPVDTQQLSKLKLQHNKECKGLIVQIHYLQAKFTREHTFRMDLVYQKDYLLILLAQFEKSERTILSAIARVGHSLGAPAPPAPRKKRKTLRSVALGVVFVNRAKRVTTQWREQKSPKVAVLAALEEVRRKRVINAAGDAS